VSQHAVRVVRVPAPEPHPNADKLVVYRVGGLQIVRTPLPAGSLAVLVECDYIGPKALFFGAGEGLHRVKPAKIRGLYSEGLLLEAPAGAVEGADVMSQLGITRYAPPVKLTTGETAPGPRYRVPVYDLEPLHKYPDLIHAGTPVVVTEKLHGCNVRFVFDGETFHLGSRSQWRTAEKGLLSQVVKQNPWVEPWCRAFPDHVLWGEAYGWVQDLRYGHQPGQVSFRAFDVWHQGRFLGPDEGPRLSNMQAVPETYRGGFVRAMMPDLADRPSAIDGGVREGVVVRPVTPILHPELGNVVLKVVSNKYLERQG